MDGKIDVEVEILIRLIPKTTHFVTQDQKILFYSTQFAVYFDIAVGGSRHILVQ